MDDINQAVVYFEDAVKESDEIIEDCSEALKTELTIQKEHFVVALAAMRKQVPKSVLPHEKIEELCKCPECEEELCRDDEFLRYCPTCGQALQI
jgi:hypothetical protein